MIVKDSLRLSVLVRPCRLAYLLNFSGIRFDSPVSSSGSMHGDMASYFQERLFQKAL